MTSVPGDKPIEILLVEDNPGDARLAHETLNSSIHPTNITVAEDGEGAIARLRKEGEYESSPTTDLILLNFRLPGMDSPEVLEEISGDPNLAKIPVVILTGTEAERSLLSSYNIPPSRYFRKPMELEVFDRVIGQLGIFSREPIRMPSAAAQTVPQSGRSKNWWWPFGRG